MKNCLRALVLPGLAVALVSCVSTPPAEDPVLLKLTELENRLSRMERVVNNESLVGLQSQIDQMRDEMRGIRGQAETLQFQNQEVIKQQRAQYQDLNGRLESFERGGARYPSVGQANPGLADAGDRQAYDAAFELLKNGRYDEAKTAFESFTAQYPGSSLAGNATYWLGEALYVTGDFTSSLAKFEKVVTDFPSSQKLPDAMLKIGYCHYEMKSYEAARAVLESVVAAYPDGTPGRLAAERLAQMQSEGR